MLPKLLKPDGLYNLIRIGKNNDAENFNHLSPESNGIKSLLSPRMGTGRGEGDNIESMSSMVKEEPEFYETVICVISFQNLVWQVHF